MSLLSLFSRGKNRLREVTSTSRGRISQRGLAPGTNIPGFPELSPTHTPLLHPPGQDRGVGARLHAVIPEPRSHVLGSHRLQSADGEEGRPRSAHSPPPRPLPRLGAPPGSLREEVRNADTASTGRGAGGGPCGWGRGEEHKMGAWEGPSRGPQKRLEGVMKADS